MSFTFLIGLQFLTFSIKLSILIFLEHNLKQLEVDQRALHIDIQNKTEQNCLKRLRSSL